MKRITFTITVLAALVLMGAALTSGRLNAATPATASIGPLVLENPRIAVKIDRQNSAICSIRDKDQGVAKMTFHEKWDAFSQLNNERD